MATIDRIEPVSYTTWSPTRSGETAAGERVYVGRHRRYGMRGLGLLRLFYVARHRRR
jgi:hypothetical protein